jgi:hypothetical protein
MSTTHLTAAFALLLTSRVFGPALGASLLSAAPIPALAGRALATSTSADIIAQLQFKEMGLLSWLIVDFAINWGGWAVATLLKVGRVQCEVWVALTAHESAHMLPACWLSTLSQLVYVRNAVHMHAAVPLRTQAGSAEAGDCLFAAGTGLSICAGPSTACSPCCLLLLRQRSFMMPWAAPPS